MTPDTQLLDLHRRDIVDLIGRRVVATAIDYVLIFNLLALGDYSLGNALYQKTIGAWLVLCALYMPVMEVWFGCSLGKFVLGLRVRHLDGSQCGWKAALIRTVLRLVEVNPLIFTGLPAVIAVVSTRDRQRLGDRLAKTIVVRTDHLRERRANQALQTTPVTRSEI